MKKRWSSLSQPDLHYNDLTGSQLTPYQNKDENGNEIGADKWENIYHTRSTVNDETLKKKHILFLGDSFVYGHGVRRGSTISDYFNEMVSEDYSCFNLAEPGSGFDTALLRLQQWCNGFGDQVHTIYFGISEITRLRHWVSSDINWQWEDDIMKEEEENHWDHIGVQYSPSLHFEPRKKRIDRDWGNSHPQIIWESYNKLVSNVNSVAKLHATISAVINLSKIHNFKVYFFGTAGEIPTFQTIKEQTESQTVKWCNAIGNDPIMIAWEQHKQNTGELANPEQKRKMKSWDDNYIPNDGHWNSKGCNMVARMLYEETYDWY